MRKSHIYVFSIIFLLASVGFAKGFIGKVKIAERKIPVISAEIEPLEELSTESEEAVGESGQIIKEELEQIAKESSDSQVSTKNQEFKNDSFEEVGQKNKDAYPWHKNITVTIFWAGEEAGEDNKNISNIPSAWDEKWVKRYGGVDDPKKRNGFYPAKFIPKENPFYFALPYNDFDEDGKRKKEVYSLAGWAKLGKWGDDESVFKNRWIAINKKGKTTYAQWQDVGPFKEDDKDYVFGSAMPKSKINKNAGLDVSPAVRDYLGLSDIDKVDWKFIDDADVPDGPWKKIVTKSQVYWK